MQGEGNCEVLIKPKPFPSHPFSHMRPTTRKQISIDATTVIISHNRCHPFLSLSSITLNFHQFQSVLRAGGSVKLTRNCPVGIGNSTRAPLDCVHEAGCARLIKNYQRKKYKFNVARMRNIERFRSARELYLLILRDTRIYVNY